MITQEQYNVLLQPVQEKFIKMEVYDKNNNFLNSIEGALISGTLNIDATVSIRRQLSNVTFVVLNSKFVPSPSSYFWINTKIHISVGIRSMLTGNVVWFDMMGWYIISKPDLKKTQTTLEMTISGYDYMAFLNGTRGGFLSSANKTEIAVNSPISQMIRSNLESLANEHNYMVDDVKDSNGNILTTPYLIDMTSTDSIFSLIDKLGSLYAGYEKFYTSGTSTSQPVFIFQSIKDRTGDAVVWDFSQNYIIETLDNQPDLDNPKNDIWVRGNTNTQYSPTGLTLTATTGTLIAGVYSYCVTAVTPSGESTPCLETSITLSSTGGVNLAWTAVSLATSYKIYGRTANGELYIGTSTLVTFTDSGSITPSGVMPTGQAFAHVQNTDDVNSPFSINNWGRTINFTIIDTTYSTNDQCLSRANFELWMHSYLAEQIQIVGAPIFPLDGNQVVSANNPEVRIIGKYLTQKVTFDLKPDGKMTLDCARLYKYQNNATTWS